MTDGGSVWRLCSICRSEISFSQRFFICSVSTCNRKRNPLYFCTLGCWEAHLPMMRHRDAWAEEASAPTQAEWEQQRLEPDDDDGDVEDDEVPDVSRKRAPAFSETDISETTGVRRISEHAREAVELYDEHRKRRIVERGQPEDAGDELPRDILVVVSKLKKYVKAKSGMNTSEGVAVVLSDHLRRICTEAIRNAARDGRKTVMDRDFEGLV